MTFNIEKPYMSDAEIEIMDGIVSKFRPEFCLEWGSGGSTNYFPRKYGFIKRWESIEHSNDWYIKIRNDVPSNVDLNLVEKKDYYSKVYHSGKKYDFILVDGLYRQACMVVAKRVLSKHGFVILHDSGRREYDPAFDIFDNWKELIEGELLREDKYSYKHRGLTILWDGEEDLDV